MKVVPSLFVSLWCMKCKKRAEHVMTNLENPEKGNTPALVFECQECGLNKKVFSLES